MINSRAKGKTGELELAAFLREHGFESRRGQQFKGGGDSPDVTGIPGWHVECKRVEKGNFYDWLKQAIDDGWESFDKPVVMHRRNHEEWVAILRLEDFLELVKK
jgi:Holliday junction resolvase